MDLDLISACSGYVLGVAASGICYLLIGLLAQSQDMVDKLKDIYDSETVEREREENGDDKKETTSK